MMDVRDDSNSGDKICVITNQILILTIFIWLSDLNLQF